MCKKTTSLDQWDQIGGVQQEQNRAENRPLRYTAHDQSRGRCRRSGSNILAPADQVVLGGQIFWRAVEKIERRRPGNCISLLEQRYAVPPVDDIRFFPPPSRKLGLLILPRIPDFPLLYTTHPEEKGMSDVVKPYTHSLLV